MLIIGHRGAARIAPENTLESLQAGFEAGADMLEFDVRLTRDNVLVVIHDANLLRTHHKLSFVHSQTYKELVSTAGEQPITRLDEVLDSLFGKIILNIELKSRGTGRAVAELLKAKYIKKSRDWDAVIFSSFKGRELWAARRAAKACNLALLHSENPFLFIAYHRTLRLTAVGFHRLYLNPLALEIAKRSGLFIYTYTVNRPEALKLLAHSGVDGVVTDDPGLMIRTIHRQG